MGMAFRAKRKRRDYKSCGAAGGQYKKVGPNLYLDNSNGYSEE